MPLFKFPPSFTFFPSFNFCCKARKESSLALNQLANKAKKDALRGLDKTKNAALKKLKLAKMQIEEQTHMDKKIQDLVTGSVRKDSKALAGAEGHMVTKRKKAPAQRRVSKAVNAVTAVSGFKKAGGQELPPLGI
jgi:hypothetical protein